MIKQAAFQQSDSVSKGKAYTHAVRWMPTYAVSKRKN